MAATSSFRPTKKGDRGGEIITIRLVPLAWTPRGVAVGSALQDVGIPLSGLFDWIDRTFPPEDEGAFIASVRDVEILARTHWETPFPQIVDERSVLNLEDLPEAVADGLAHPPSDLVACAACRRLCVRNEFLWKEKQLCAWDHTRPRSASAGRGTRVSMRSATSRRFPSARTSRRRCSTNWAS
ncbi:MAG TPA: hypothetical protein VGM99_00700, partial [Candidatus Cybelea sp.]